MPDDIADFVGGKPGIQRDREIMEPDFASLSSLRTCT